MTTVTVSEKGQVVIPAAIRRGLGIKAGTELEFELEGSEIARECAPCGTGSQHR